ncbi:hypothetical protein D030_3623B, partial [Vibrio parahaemolyticus AQ3810]
RSELP